MAFQDFIRQGAQKIFSLEPREERNILQEEVENSGLLSNAIHLGGKIPKWLKGKLTEAKERVKEIPQMASIGQAVNQEEPYLKSSQSQNLLDIDKAFDALTGHESRGTGKPEVTVADVTKATGISQITPVAFKEWQNKYTTDKEFAKSVSFDDLVGDALLQERITRELINGISSKHGNILGDWSTSTTKLKKYKEEINKDFNHPIYWLAGEWIAGPDWVSKLDNKTATGSKETVRDYMVRVGDLYFGQKEDLVENIK